MSRQRKWCWELPCFTSDSCLKCEFPHTNIVGPANSAPASLQYLHSMTSLSRLYCSHGKASSHSFRNLYCLKLPVTDIFCFLQGTTAPTSCSSCSFSSCFLKLLCSASFETELLKIKFDAFHPNTALIQRLSRRKIFTPLAWVTGIKSNQSQCETSLLMLNVCVRAFGSCSFLATIGSVAQVDFFSLFLSVVLLRGLRL